MFAATLIAADGTLRRVEAGVHDVKDLVGARIYKGETKLAERSTNVLIAQKGCTVGSYHFALGRQESIVIIGDANVCGAPESAHVNVCGHDNIVVCGIHAADLARYKKSPPSTDGARWTAGGHSFSVPGGVTAQQVGPKRTMLTLDSADLADLFGPLQLHKPSGTPNRVVVVESIEEARDVLDGKAEGRRPSTLDDVCVAGTGNLVVRILPPIKETCEVDRS